MGWRHLRWVRSRWPFFEGARCGALQGDSIIDGGRQRTGSDYNHIMGQNYAYLLAGEIGAQSPERELIFVNRGISGNRVRKLEARWQADTIALHARLLSILIGVNDDALAKAPAEHWSWDGVRPTCAGHGLMAREWLKTVDAF